MKSYEERLATFSSWPHTFSFPQPKEFAAAAFVYAPTKECHDNVQCDDCAINLDSWKEDDNALIQHLRRSPKCASAIKMRRDWVKTILDAPKLSIQAEEAQEAAEKEARKAADKEAQEAQEAAQKAAQKEAQRPTPTPRDIGFFDPSLQFDFPELRLYHEIDKFVEHILQCADQYREVDVIELLPKCLRGPAFQWSQSIQEALKNVTLAKYMEVLTAKFRKPPTAAQETPKPASQTTPLEYHKCTLCSASFSSISRLLSHSQMVICNKASCKHCETTFESKNQLHEHLRSRECQQSSPTKSIAPLKSSLSALAPAESATSSPFHPPSALPEYRAVSPPPPTYETAPRSYLTVADLYMRYAPLKSAVSSRIRHPPITCKSVKSSWIRPVTCSRTVLPTLTVKDLYEKFHGKENPVISAVKWTPAHGRQIGFSAVKPACVAKTPAIDSILVPHKGAKTRFFTQAKTSAQRLNSQQQHHVTATFFTSPRDMAYDYRRRHSRRPEACC